MDHTLLHHPDSIKAKSLHKPLAKVAKVMHQAHAASLKKEKKG